jgi:hypothetical protein
MFTPVEKVTLYHDLDKVKVNLSLSFNQAPRHEGVLGE